MFARNTKSAIDCTINTMIATVGVIRCCVNLEIAQFCAGFDLSEYKDICGSLVSLRLLSSVTVLVTALFCYFVIVVPLSSISSGFKVR